MSTASLPTGALRRATAALLALGTLALAPAAQAYTLALTSANGHQVDTSFSSAGMLSVDTTLTSGLPLTLTLTPDGGDPALLALNAIVRNGIGLGFEALQLQLDGALFHTLGSAGGTFGTVATVSGGGQQAVIRFTGPEYVEATLGDWFLDGSQADFVLDIGSATGPVTLTLTSAVPEPASAVLLLAGLALAGTAARRQRR